MAFPPKQIAPDHLDTSDVVVFNHSGSTPNPLAAKASRVSDNSHWTRAEAKIWMVVLLMGTCLLYCARVTMPICISVMAEQFKWDKKQSGIVLGSFFWGYTMTQIAGGYTSDRLGGDKVLLLSAIAWGTVTTLTPLLAYCSSTPIFLLTVSRFFMGLLQGVHFPSLASLFSSKVRESERAFTSSTVCTGTQFGTLVIGGAGSVLLDRYGWQSVFYFSGLLTILWVYCMWIYLIKGQGRTISFESLSSSLVNSQANEVPWIKLFKKPSVWAIFVAHVCMASTFFCLLSWIPTFFHDSYPDSKGWIFNVVPWIVSIPLSLMGGLLSDHLISLGFDTAKVRKSMQVVAMGISSIFIKLLCYSPSYYRSLLFVSAAVGLQTFSHSGTSVNVQDLAPSCAGSLFGVMNTGGALAGVVLVYFAGYLIETTGSWPSVFNLVSIINMFGLSVYVLFGQATRADV